MTLLEVIVKASSNPQVSSEPLKYLIPLNSDPVLLNLKPASDNPISSSLVVPLSGFQIPELDLSLNASNSKFFKQLSKTLNSLSASDFTIVLNSFLEEIGATVQFWVDKESCGERYTHILIEKLGSFIGRDVFGLIIEGCVLFDNWGLLETLIVNKLVDHRLCSNLLHKLIGKRRSDLVCLCVKYFSDLNSSDVRRILEYFLSPEDYKSMDSVRKEWEKQALLAIAKASDKKLNELKPGLAKRAAILFMVAYDGFSAPELCMHYLFSSSSVDEVVMSSAIGKLRMKEMLRLIKYLGKWLRKYERFPQACPCPDATTTLGLKECKWVPTLENIVRTLELVIDEHFSSLVLHSEFGSELKAIEEVVRSLVSEGKLCCPISNLIEILDPAVKGT